MKRILLIVCLSVFSAFATNAANAAVAMDPVPIVFEIPSTLNATDTYVQFFNCVNNASSITGTYNNATTLNNSLQTNRAYALADLTSPTSVGGSAPASTPAVSITEFISGRIYVTIGGAGLDVPSHCYQPNPANPSDANFTRRYQYFEANVNASSITADLSYIDFASISMSMEAVNATTSGVNTPQLTKITSTVLMDRVATTSVLGNRLPVTGKSVRVISPSMQAPLYHDWSWYLNSTLQGTPVYLNGTYVGTGNQPSASNATQAQSFSYIATFDTFGNATLTPQKDSGNGTAPCVPAVQQGQGVGNGTDMVITISLDSLNNAAGVYGNNPSYKIGGGTPTAGIVNDFSGRVVGDLLAGMSWGFPASKVTYKGTAIGNLTSTEWWGGRMVDNSVLLLADTPAGNGTVFSKVQTNSSNYHTYADALDGYTSGYGFALQDRLGNNLLQFDTSVDTNAYLKFSIEPEAPHTSVFESTSQAAGVTVKLTNFTGKTLTAAQLSAQYSTKDFTPHTSVCSFNGTVSPAGSVATFMMDCDKLPTGTVSELQLLKLYSSGATLAYKYAVSGISHTDGYWWVTDSSGNHLMQMDSLVYGTQYYIHFVIKDDGPYDENPVAGQITDPVSAGTKSDTSSGCVLNSNAGFTFEIAGLFLIAVFGICLRRRVRVRNRSL
ncbi:beta-1,3-glucanase family protein [Maridesulfovibrio frigidus]|uniref:beta-1,3-glucanase family protein n=1 Tax=Maridesulfovibrio frigidus TaxID=340956 RepID=UPI0004E27201|nr:beta-1,3-glucanase family protein [Maridesulfovibrio frigidus]